MPTPSLSGNRWSDYSATSPKTTTDWTNQPTAGAPILLVVRSHQAITALTAAGWDEIGRRADDRIVWLLRTADGTSADDMPTVAVTNGGARWDFWCGWYADVARPVVVGARTDNAGGTFSPTVEPAVAAESLCVLVGTSTNTSNNPFGNPGLSDTGSMNGWADAGGGPNWNPWDIATGPGTPTPPVIAGIGSVLALVLSGVPFPPTPSGGWVTGAVGAIT